MSTESIASALLAMATVALVAYGFGRVANRLGQPAVVGEMVAGVALGPTLLGRVAPQVGDYLFGQDERELLAVLGTIGLALYMFYVGVQHRTAPVPHRGTALAVRVASVGVLLPFALGAVAASTALARFRPADIDLVTYTLFVAGAMTVTAFPMMGRMLEERRMESTRLGVVAIRAAALDDVVAWTILAVLTASVAGALSDIVTRTLVPVLLFVLVCATVVPRLFGPLVHRVASGGKFTLGASAAVLGAVLLAAALTEWAGVYAVFGGFLLGVFFPTSQGFSDAVETSLMPLVRVILLPTFFAYSGLQTDFGLISTAETLWALAIVLVVAFVAKLGAPWLALAGQGWTTREALAVGALLNARGLMILIFINIGLALGIIDSRIFAMLALVAIISTAIARPAYTWVLGPGAEALLRNEERAVVPAPRESGGQ